MTGTITVAARFNGPSESGNGGYAAGLLAARLGERAEVSLRSPVPLDTALTVGREGESLRVLDGETLVAEAHPAPPGTPETPAPVGLAEARHAAAHAYRGPTDGLFAQCFVCGRARPDSMHVFAGEVEGRDLVATPWSPPGYAADSTGAVRPEFVWAALDCPTYFATYLRQELALSFLVRQSVEIHAPVRAGAEHLVIAWPLEVEGRKRHAGAALLAADGEPLATCRALLVEPRG